MELESTVAISSSFACIPVRRSRVVLDMFNKMISMKEGRISSRDDLPIFTSGSEARHMGLTRVLKNIQRDDTSLVATLTNGRRSSADTVGGMEDLWYFLMFALRTGAAKCFQIIAEKLGRLKWNKNHAAFYPYELGGAKIEWTDTETNILENWEILENVAEPYMRMSMAIAPELMKENEDKFCPSTPGLYH